ncbi:MAG: ABC transporter ATP-binding protein [Amylibacter sp.]|nr:ABC transporter ATP-binding protein [Amylibacter sp.]
MLKIENINVGYDGTAVLHAINAQFEPGTLTALVGPNGTGKSSLLKAMAGLIPSKGVVRLGDLALNSAGRLSSIAYMPQDTGAQSSLTVLEVVLLGRLRSLGLRVGDDIRAQAVAALQRFRLEGFQDRAIGALSGGQRQLVFLSQSLFRGPDVLLLDEPTAALDLRHQLIVLERIKETCRTSGMIAVAAMHDLTLAARFADRIVFLHDGQVAADGPPADVLTPQILEQVYRVAAEVQLGPSGTLHVSPVRALSDISAG